MEADFKGGNLSADGGVLLLREIDQRTGMIDQLATCFTDYRDSRLIEHSVPELLRQRILSAWRWVTRTSTIMTLSDAIP